MCRASGFGSDPEQKPRENVTFPRKEFLDFLKWAGIGGDVGTFKDGKQIFTLDPPTGQIHHSGGDIFTLEEVSP